MASTMAARKRARGEFRNEISGIATLPVGSSLPETNWKYELVPAALHRSPETRGFAGGFPHKTTLFTLKDAAGQGLAGFPQRMMRQTGRSLRFGFEKYRQENTGTAKAHQRDFPAFM